MNFKHLFKHDWVTIFDEVSIIGYENLKVTEIVRTTTRLCKVCSKIDKKSTKLVTLDKIYTYKQKLQLAEKCTQMYGVTKFKFGDI